MNWEYKYTKDIDAAIFSHIVKLDDVLVSKFIQTKVSKNMDGTFPTDNVVVEFNAALTPEEHDILNVLIDTYGPTNKYVEIFAIMKARAVKGRAFGAWMIDYVGSRNVQMQKTSEQMVAMTGELSSVMSLLMGGSIELAYGAFQQLEAGGVIPNSNYSADELAEDKKLVQAYIGNL